jgi:hypothetical protein
MAEDSTINQFLKMAGSAAAAGVDGIKKTFSPDRDAEGKLKKLAESDYEYTTINYPSTLGESATGRHPYYITFFFNIQDLSKWAKRGSTNDLVARTGVTVTSTEDPRGVEFATIKSTVTRNQSGVGGSTKNIIGNFGFGRKTSRTKAAVRLYMPDTLAWSYTNKFNDVSISGLPGMAAIAGGTSMVDHFKNGGTLGGLASINNTTAAGVEVLGKLMGGYEQLALASVGLAVNPQIDVIYETPQLRTFTFEFVFAPRNLKEAEDVKKIIKLFKFHSAPELLGDGSVFGRYFVPPSEFDIEFNVQSMGKISTCILENLTVDYAPTGSAFYADETPVHTRMTLQFRELEFMTKELIDGEGY